MPTTAHQSIKLRTIDFRNAPASGTLFRHKGEIYKLIGVWATHSFSQLGCDLINSGQITDDEAWRRSNCVSTTYEVEALCWNPARIEWEPVNGRSEFARFYDDQPQPRCVTGVKSLPVGPA